MKKFTAYVLFALALMSNLSVSAQKDRYIEISAADTVYICGDGHAYYRR
jgi:hypothetical protein